MEQVQVVRVKNDEEGAAVVFDIVSKLLKEQQLNVLGLATGSTMIPVYDQWTSSDLDFSNVTAFNLDEYVGLDENNPNSYAYFMQQHLFSKKPFKKTYIPNGMADNLDKECADYEILLYENPLDLQLLGVGENGHIAFNEPFTPISSLTHVAHLTPSTRSVNGQYFDDHEEMPSTALTMGVLSILRAKRLILLAFGERKRAAIEKVLEGKVDPEWPITYILEHPDVTIITDIE